MDYPMNSVPADFVPKRKGLFGGGGVDRQVTPD
jgi:hypothetical protein